jgi:lysyl-tRNA synthetase class 2
MTSEQSWQPSCSVPMLHMRAAMLQAIRLLFQQQGYLEVQTPCLSRDIVIDAHLEPFQLQERGQRWYLQTSPEAHMKRLLAAGSGSIFQITPVFRRDELGERHNPEFLMIEWYGVGSTWEQQLEFTETLVRTAVQAAVPFRQHPAAVWPDGRFRHVTYADAFWQTLGIDVHQSGIEDLRRIARQRLVPVPETGPEPSLDDWRNLLLAMLIEPQLGGFSGQERPEFLCDYPPTQAALAVVTDTDPPVARRFELYIRGIELCNGYQELTDPVELTRREQTQNTGRKAEDRAELPGAPRLTAALQAGLPECSGVALGFDRLAMIAAGVDCIDDVMPFPGMRA